MAKKENKIYCWNCGIGNSIQEEKCVKCGKKLRKKNHPLLEWLFGVGYDEIKGNFLEKVFQLLKAFFHYHLYGTVMIISIAFLISSVILFSGIEEAEKTTEKYRIEREEKVVETLPEEEPVEVPSTTNTNTNTNSNTNKKPSNTNTNTNKPTSPKVTSSYMVGCWKVSYSDNRSGKYYLRVYDDKKHYIEIDDTSGSLAGTSYTFTVGSSLKIVPTGTKGKEKTYSKVTYVNAKKFTVKDNSVTLTFEKMSTCDVTSGNGYIASEYETELMFDQVTW